MLVSLLAIVWLQWHVACASHLLQNIQIAICAHVKAERGKPRPEFDGVLETIRTWQTELVFLQNNIEHVELDIYVNEPFGSSFVQPRMIDTKSWPSTFVVRVHDMPFQGYELADSYKSTWRERSLPPFSPRRPKPTAWILLEDDMVLRPEVLVSWAQDAALFQQVGLEDAGFKRSLFRFERNSTGDYDLIDQRFNIRFRDLWPGACTNATSLPCIPPDNDFALPWCVQLPFVVVRAPYGKMRVFVALGNPYCAASLATYNQIQHWTTTHWAFPYSPYKHKYDFALRATAAFSVFLDAENAEDVPTWGKEMRALVPLNTLTLPPHLALHAGIYHSSNNYWGRGNDHTTPFTLLSCRDQQGK